MGVAVNLVTYLTGTMHLGSANSANTVTNFMGTSFMLCLLGGFVADTFIGRFVTTDSLVYYFQNKAKERFNYFIPINFVTVLFLILYIIRIMKSC